MDQLITITELARLRNVTTETLRFYDRKGILKPSYIDPNNGRRYYTIVDCERLGTIRELQQMNMSLDEIAAFLNERNPKTSYNLLCQKEKELKEQIKQLRALYRTIQRRKEKFKYVIENRGRTGIVLRHIDRRWFLSLENGPIYTEEEVWRTASELEKILSDASGAPLPVFATSCYTGIIAKEDVEKAKIPALLVFETEENHELFPNQLIEIEAGEFVCLLNNNVFWEREEAIHRIMQYIRENGYELTGNILQVIQVDDTVTNDQNDISFEFQAPVRKNCKHNT